MKYHYTVYKIEQNGKLSNKEHLNDNELDKWMEKVHDKFANIRVERNDGNWVEYTSSGSKYVIKKKGKGISEMSRGSGRWKGPMKKYREFKKRKPNATDSELAAYTGLSRYEISTLATVAAQNFRESRDIITKLDELII
jgi:hypothetical protein